MTVSFTASAVAHREVNEAEFMRSSRRLPGVYQKPRSRLETITRNPAIRSGMGKAMAQSLNQTCATE